MPPLSLGKRGMCMKTIIYFISPDKKWLLLIPYLLTVFWTWQRRHMVPAPLGELTRDSVLIAFAIVGFVCLVGLLRYPLFENQRFQRAFEQIGLHNSMGEYPTLVAKRADKHKEHGAIYELKNVGISMRDFDNKNAQIEAALDLKVYRVEYGRKARTILVYAIPRKHAKPTIISLNDEYLAKQLCSLPNLLCVGKTGSGKSYALSVLLGLYAHYIPNVSITICDYKKSSFAQFEDTVNFYGYEDVPDGIKAFYQEFSERLEANDEQRNKHIRVLLIDEYGALIGAQDKKTVEELKSMVANMLFMGRSLGMRVLIGVQRADAEHFKAGARDQFRSILALGQLSREQKQMLFADYKDKMAERNGLGEGYLLIDGQDIERVKIAPIKDFEALNDTIRQTMCR